MENFEVSWSKPLAHAGTFIAMDVNAGNHKDYAKDAAGGYIASIDYTCLLIELICSFNMMRWMDW